MPCFALDCEMVGDTNGRDMLGRVSVVNENAICVYDKFVKPERAVGSYRTQFSGLRKQDLVNGEDRFVVQNAVKDILQDNILIGHDVLHDLEVIGISHPTTLIRDTSQHAKFINENWGRKPALRHLARRYLNTTIQNGEHDSVQDAACTMRLYQRYMS